MESSWFLVDFAAQGRSLGARLSTEAAASGNFGKYSKRIVR
jgi:hypothetical protein